MTKTIKNILSLAVIVSILVMAYASLKYTDSYNKKIQPSSFRSFSVTGEAKINALPDIAKFNLQIISQGGSDIGALQAKNTKIGNQITTFLKKEGIADKDIKTQSYNISPRYETSNCHNINLSLRQTCPPPTIVGYNISQTINVKVHNFSKIGEIMKGAVKAGANQVSSLSFTIDDPSSIQNEARTKAIAKAQEKAQAIAKAGGFKVGKLLNIQEGYQSFQNSSMLVRESANSQGGFGISPTINPGSQEVQSRVTLRYEIK